MAVLLPSVSLWSSAIGKDVIAFLSINCALWASLNLRRRVGLMIFAIVSMLLVRPHMAGILVIALSIAMVFDKNVKLLGKAVLIVLDLAAALL